MIMIWFPSSEMPRWCIPWEIPRAGGPLCSSPDWNSAGTKKTQMCPQGLSGPSWGLLKMINRWAHRPRFVSLQNNQLTGESQFLPPFKVVSHILKHLNDFHDSTSNWCRGKKNFCEDTRRTRLNLNTKVNRKPTNAVWMFKTIFFLKGQVFINFSDNNSRLFFFSSVNTP